MKYRLLGKSSLEISEISFGCMSLGQDEQENSTLINRAIEYGINFFDTADLYEKGQNEIKVGEILKGKRNQVLIATKVGNRWRSDGSGWDWNPRKEYILSAVEESLKRLQTDYIDLYQLHGGTIQDPIDETVEAFELLVQQGKIRYYGISSIRPNVIREYIQRSRITSVMMQYSLLDRRPEETCMALLQENNIGMLVRGGLAQGLLAGKPARSYLNYQADEVEAAAEAVRAVSAGHCGLAATALRFVLQQKPVTSAVVGMRTLQQLEDAIETVNAPLLTEEELKQLRSAVQSAFYAEHR